MPVHVGIHSLVGAGHTAVRVGLVATVLQQTADGFVCLWAEAALFGGTSSAFSRLLDRRTFPSDDLAVG